MSLCKKGCAASRCGGCYMERNGRDLVEKFNWLEMRPFPKFGVGCSVCRQAIETGKLKGFSQAGQDWRSCSVTGYLSLQTRRLEKHESSRDHVRAAGSHRLEDPCSAPRLKDFHELLAHVRKSPIGTCLLYTSPSPRDA